MGSKAKKGDVDGRKLVCRNRRAWHEYEILETVEAGMVLVGTEVKSLREGRVNLKDSYAKVDGDEVFLVDAHISPYSHGNIMNHDPLRPRKLLLHKKEIRRLGGKVSERGLTLIPLEIYFKEGRAKVELGLARGKRLYDKRAAIKKRDERRELQRELKARR
ncbi:MAG: SsrA-binding protein SmpB [Thermodesulfobacteriota bacterium]